jgi:hypothetical protein
MLLPDRKPACARISFAEGLAHPRECSRTSRLVEDKEPQAERVRAEAPSEPKHLQRREMSSQRKRKRLVG